MNKNIVTSFEFSKKLEAEGWIRDTDFERNTLFFWTPTTNVADAGYFLEHQDKETDTNYVLLCSERMNLLRDPHLKYPAPTLSELLDRLPMEYSIKRLLCNDGQIRYTPFKNSIYLVQLEVADAFNPCDVAAAMWLYDNPTPKGGLIVEFPKQADILDQDNLEGGGNND